jgi:hypothetical protein
MTSPRPPRNFVALCGTTRTPVRRAAVAKVSSTSSGTSPHARVGARTSTSVIAGPAGGLHHDQAGPRAWRRGHPLRRHPSDRGPQGVRSPGDGRWGYRIRTGRGIRLGRASYSGRTATTLGPVRRPGGREAGRQRRHAAGEHHRRLAVLELGRRGLEPGDGRLRHPAMDRHARGARSPVPWPSRWVASPGRHERVGRGQAQGYGVYVQFGGGRRGWHVPRASTVRSPCGTSRPGPYASTVRSLYDTSSARTTAGRRGAPETRSPVRSPARRPTAPVL